MNPSDQTLEADRKKKQLFLKAEIIDNGYEGSDFATFLNSVREGGGDDIDIWSFDELQQLVNQFIRSKTGNSEVKKVPEGTGQSPTLHDAALAGSAFQIKKGDDTDPTKDKEDVLEEILTVKSLETSELNGTSLVNSQVIEPELVKGGIFSASYIMYKVKTTPFNWIVNRRYSDFDWLHLTLQKFYPGFVIPPIPNKKSKGKFENDFIKKRMYFLSRFLNACLKQDEIKANKFLVIFLKETDEKKFQEAKKQAEKLLKAQKLEEIATISGKVNLEITPELKAFSTSASDMFTATEPIYKKIRVLSKQLQSQMEDVSNTIFGIGECFANLYNASNTFNKSTPMGKNPTLDDIYLTLNNMMASWGERMLHQIKLVQRNLTFFFKYAFFENNGFKDVMKNRFNAGSDYIKRKRELIAKKERLYTLGDLSKWEIPPTKLKDLSREELMKNKAYAFEVMLPKETLQVFEMKQMFAYYNSQAFQEISKGLQEKNRQYVLNFYEFAKDQSDNLTECHVLWADMMAHFTASKPSKELRTVMNRETVGGGPPEGGEEYKMDGNFVE